MGGPSRHFVLEPMVGATLTKRIVILNPFGTEGFSQIDFGNGPCSNGVPHRTVYVRQSLT
jgi:hypothetical protein